MESEPRPFSFRVPEAVEEGRADKILAQHFQDISRAQIQKACDAGQILCNGKVLRKRDPIRGGDLLEICWIQEVDLSARPVEIPLDILLEDEHLVVVNKPAGLVTHPGHGTQEPTLVHALLHHTQEGLSSIGAPERPGIVHRLDKETSGILVVAKTDTAHQDLMQQFKQRSLVKRYLAWVEGSPRLDSGVLDGAIGRHPVVRTKMMISEEGRSARTDWKVLQRYSEGPSLLECRIHTGRTHQIRVHLASLGHPILGDKTYGYRAQRRPWEPIPRVLLHAFYLELEHPVSGERLILEAPLPEDFRSLRTRLESP